MSTKRSAASIAAASHWSKRTKPDASVPIVIPSDSDNDTDYSDGVIQVEDGEDKAAMGNPEFKAAPTKTLQLNSSSSSSSSLPFCLLETPSLGIPKDGVSLEELISFSDLTASFQFNFSVEVNFFLEHIHKMASPDITFITGTPGLLEGIKSRFNISLLVAPIADRFGTHHTKMMINFFSDETVEIIIMTANLTLLDFGALTQMCWRSGRLPRHLSSLASSESGTIFQNDLINYLKRYKLLSLNELGQKLKHFDFGSVTDVELFASTPGTYNLENLSSDSEIYGYGRFLQLLQKNNLCIDSPDLTSNNYNILAQISSIASPYKSAKGDAASIFSHIICPIAFSSPSEPFSPLDPGSKLFQSHMSINNYKPHIIYPTGKNVSICKVGWGGGQALHFNYNRSSPAASQYAQNIRPYICQWKSKLRSGAPPHVKIYACDNADNWSTLRWALMCSHNLSKQAWGYPIQGKWKYGEVYKVASYELGIFIGGKGKKLLPGTNTSTMQSEETDVFIPFDLPPQAYNNTDKPWSYTESYPGLKDVNGRPYTGLG